MRRYGYWYIEYNQDYDITSINDDIPYIDWLVGCVNYYDEIDSQSRKI